MRRLLPLLLGLVALPLVAASPLADHPSPYLALHADDPVQWQLWDKALLAQAQREDKLIFVSSGYFACHWCHVMQRESYQNDEIAALLNRHFLSVKIDRELRPDIDARLFEFVEQELGVAGWPLNVFLSPYGEPISGLVYQPPQLFARTLRRVVEQWQEKGDKPGTEEPGTGVSTAQASQLVSEPGVLRDQLEQALLAALEQQGDFFSGGFGEGGKFPRVPLLTLMLEHYRDHPVAEGLLRLTLEQMHTQGLRDHLGGGFFRYTVDPQWREPHFEKMLYDNAQLAWLYLRAAQLLDEPAYRRVGEQTLDFMLRDMWHPRGGLSGSISALDGEGRDGGYYLWTREALTGLLSEEELALLRDVWEMEGAPVFEHGYLPRASTQDDERLRAVHQRLLRERQQRRAPLDSKRLAGWNALALRALSLGAEKARRYRVAGAAIDRYLKSLWDGEQLWMMRDDGGALRQHATLEDYALVAGGLYAWHRASGDSASRELAATLLKAAASEFYRTGRWRLGSGGETGLLERHYAVRPAGALPSPVAELLKLQRSLGLALLPEEQLLHAAPGELLASPLDYPGYLALLVGWP
ncbi:MAG: DUF255 domain-containing protein [Gammaproteobacteria bacterium]|nr:DUF255 domain-containing protein [Gammaproteobacteria bacterium]MCW8841576.1 DUF255 domain-containing protein [Gammaproteobacteria bacterium]MCW8927576.1 DUF255 domain-containing protein [Gammaproteobacteria bacterium]MCW8958286.1 DUF255 domain-containing protein [Gammaproteobacteria bacterium]MCW8972907.1 DUF255 domain-containing protein [Gammaproteobacteria bacterium]